MSQEFNIKMLNVHFSESTLVAISMSWQDHTHTLSYRN